MMRVALTTVTAGVIALAAGQAAAAQDAEVIELTQVGCQFIESENGVDRGYDPQKAEDCNAINARTADERLADQSVIKLTPGTYTFRVTNKDVPYELGFFLREPDFDYSNPIHQATKTAVSGGGLTTGKTQDYEVTLEPGEYIYSCPLNPTPDYTLVVTEE